MPLSGSSKHRRLQYWLWLWLVLVLGATANHAIAEWYERHWSIMGTQVGARIWWHDAQEAEQLLMLVRDEMERIDQTYSPYINTSPLSRINQQAARTPQTLNEEFARLINKALWVNQISQGAFDITYASVGHFYDYRAGVAASDQQLTEALPAVGRLDWQPETRQLSFSHPAVKIDLGGLAKGYAVDSAAALLRSRGVKHASVNAGGDTRLIGDNLGRPWLIGIKHPRPAPGANSWDSVIKMPLNNEAISTSGDYERFFIDSQTGQRIHHIINPKTGHSTNELISVSVIGPEGFTTDPLSTAVFVLGAERGLAMIDQLPGYEAVLISANGEVRYSQGLMPPAGP